jgi:probable addiction module antidote protein
MKFARDDCRNWPMSMKLNPGKYRHKPEAVAEYLNAALSTNDPFVITRAISSMVRAQGTKKFSREAGITRDVLARTFEAEDSAAFDAVLKLLFTLGIRLVAAPVGKPDEPIIDPAPASAIPAATPGAPDELTDDVPV